jgi:diketogulonate reductase-like aldo/keto reductase
MKRRTTLQRLTALAASALFPAFSKMSNTILQRAIPNSGEKLPVVGLGTWQTFDVGSDPSELNPLRQVLQELVNKGASVVDSSPMYGRSEQVVGNLSEELGINDKLFMATKVWTTGKENGIRQMQQSMTLLKREKLDLMQIHNLTDWKTHLTTLKQWKEQGRIRYVGITHYTESAYNRIENILKTEPIDFLQINYSLMSRKAEERLFPLAQEKKVAVLINRPFEEGALFQRVKGKELPRWASEIDCRSWGQFFLKFILSHPAVNCVIPGTSKPHHMLDNLGAGTGRLPNVAQRQQMIRAMA